MGQRAGLGGNTGLARARCAPGPPASTSRPAARPSCSPTARRPSTGTSVPRAVALILQAAGVEFGLMREQWCCGGPACGDGLRRPGPARSPSTTSPTGAKIGAKRIICLDPHDYITIIEDYPRYFGDDYEFEIVLAVDLVAELIRDGKLTLTNPVEQTVTYHDACRLNKRQGRLAVAAGDPAGDPGPDVRGRRPRHPVVVLLGRRLEPPDRGARA